MAKTTKKKPDDASATSESGQLMFAREILKQLVYDPQKSSSQKSITYSNYTKENLIKWLQSPGQNEANLRKASNYLYLASMHYQRLINYYSGLLLGQYVISPLGFEGKAINRGNLEKQYYKVAKTLEALNIPSLQRAALNVCLREGAFYGVLWSDKTASFVQKIDADYCKITSVCDGTFLYSVDMSKLQGKLEYYPPVFTEMYNNYLKTSQKYQEVPIDISVCIKGDDSIYEYTVPPFAALMPSLYTIENAQALQETADELRNYKIIAGLVGLDPDGHALVGDDMYLKYYSQLRGAIGDHIGLALTPFPLSAINFDEKTGISDVDNIARAVSNYWETAGTSGLLHGVANNTAGVTKLAIKNDETYVLGMMKQLERVINRYLKTELSGQVKFKITMLPITVFNRDDYIKDYKEAAAFGLGKSYYAAALGIPQYDIAGLSVLEEEVISFDSLKPLRSAYNSSSGDAGRPAKEDEDLTEEGEATRSNGANSNR